MMKIKITAGSAEKSKEKVVDNHSFTDYRQLCG
jgi:hypothetical protein